MRGGDGGGSKEEEPSMEAELSPAGVGAGKTLNKCLLDI